MEAHLPLIVKELLNSYREVGGINNLDGVNLPSKRALAVLCTDLLQLLFPGFLDDKVDHSMELRKSTQPRVESFARRLKAEVCKSLRLEQPECSEEESNRVVLHLLESLPMIRRVLLSDVEAAYEGDPASKSFEEIILAYPCIETIAVQRCAHQLYHQNVPLIPRMMTEWAHSRTGIDIHPGAHIGPHFFIDHGTGVVVGETCVIGTNVKLYHGVTLGAKSFQKDDEGRILKGGKRHPDVENNVTIYPNSTVLGGETVIGENSTIGGNVFLQHSVPANSLVYYEETQLKIVPKKKRESLAIRGGSTVLPGEYVTPKGGVEAWCDWSI
jgi:serine O-acetyltransferase